MVTIQGHTALTAQMEKIHNKAIDNSIEKDSYTVWYKYFMPNDVAYYVQSLEIEKSTTACGSQFQEKKILLGTIIGHVPLCSILL